MVYRIFIMVFCKNVYVIGTYTEECSKKYDSLSKIVNESNLDFTTSSRQPGGFSINDILKRENRLEGSHDDENEPMHPPKSRYSNEKLERNPEPRFAGKTTSNEYYEYVSQIQEKIQHQLLLNNNQTLFPLGM